MSAKKDLEDLGKRLRESARELRAKADAGIEYAIRVENLALLTESQATEALATIKKQLPEVFPS